MKKKFLIPIFVVAIVLSGCGSASSTVAEEALNQAEETMSAVSEAHETLAGNTEVATPDFEPLDHITVIFEGMAPYGTASYEIDNIEDPFWKSGVKVVLDRAYALSNADTVKVHLIYPDGTDKVKEVVVEGLDDWANYTE